MTLTKRKPRLYEALIPIVILICLLAFNVLIFGNSALDGSNQLALLFAAAVAGIIGYRIGYTYEEMQDGIVSSISTALSAILILLLIGALAGTWLLSGIVPTMIYYGLEVLNPTIFLFAACFVSAVVALATGSSWSTVATVGIALLGIGKALGLSEGIIAGSIISGAYFGDKMSPLSDTTNLAPAVAGTDLFTHIRHMAWTTVPSIIISLIIFLVIGLNIDGGVVGANVDDVQMAIQQRFYISGWLFLVPAVVIVMIVMRVPALPALLVGALLGGVFAFIFQPDILKDIWESYMLTPSVVEEIASSGALDQSARLLLEEGQWDIFRGEEEFKLFLASVVGPEQLQVNYPRWAEMAYSGTITGYRAILESMYARIDIPAGNEVVDELLTTGGMYGMLGTIWLIVCAMVFGGVMESIGMLQRITESIISWAHSTGSLITSTAVTCIFFNLTASDQYLAIVVPGRMYADTFRKRGLCPENLSRTLEDSGTVTSVLVPWNTCGLTQASVLGVATIVYFPYCFFNIISPLMTILYGYLNIKITKFANQSPEKTDTLVNV